MAGKLTAVCVRGLAYSPYNWAVFALTASLRPRKWRWEPTFRVTEGAADLYLWTEVQVCELYLHSLPAWGLEDGDENRPLGSQRSQRVQLTFIYGQKCRCAIQDPWNFKTHVANFDYYVSSMSTKALFNCHHRLEKVQTLRIYNGWYWLCCECQVTDELASLVAEADADECQRRLEAVRLLVDLWSHNEQVAIVHIPADTFSSSASAHPPVCRACHPPLTAKNIFCTWWTQLALSER